MEFALILLLFVFGLSAVIAVAIGGVVIIGSIALAILVLAVRFWYISLTIMIVLIAPLLYLDGWLPWIFLGLSFLAVALFLVSPVDAKDEKSKSEKSLQKEIAVLRGFGGNSKT